MNKCFFLSIVTAAMVQPALGADVQVTRSLSLDGAQRVLDGAFAYARAASAPGGAVAIVDAGGSVILLARLDGTFPAAPEISIGKARTAATFRKPTRVFEDLVNQGRTTMVSVPHVTAFTPLQGGVPILAGGEVVGAIGVSGAASAQQDDEIAQAGADAFATAEQLGDGSVTHLSDRKVRAAFRKGEPLVENGRYKVHASRRDAAGEAEIHLDDTDIFYVLEGTATFVTGGELLEPKTVAPGELRGSAIAGGTARKLGSGDMIVIPRGVPHWFRDVKAPFTYYVVKSTS